MALPADARTKEQLEWLADEVVEAGGEATVWLGRPGSAADERREARAYMCYDDLVFKTQRPPQLRPRTSLEKEAFILRHRSRSGGGKKSRCRYGPAAAAAAHRSAAAH